MRKLCRRLAVFIFKMLKKIKIRKFREIINNLEENTKKAVSKRFFFLLHVLKSLFRASPIH